MHKTLWPVIYGWSHFPSDKLLCLVIAWDDPEGETPAMGYFLSVMFIAYVEISGSRTEIFFLDSKS